jgi:hypothetical protein
MSKKRNKQPKVNIIERTKKGQRIVEANVQMKHGIEYDVEFASHAYLIVFFGDDEFEYDLPKWIRWDNVKIYEQGNTIFFEEIINGA